jgi:hypothetical protein
MLKDALLDLSFLGSGSTLMLRSHQPRLSGVELDSLYVDVIIRRYEAASGEAAILVETGDSFHELSARREREAS